MPDKPRQPLQHQHERQLRRRPMRRLAATTTLLVALAAVVLVFLASAPAVAAKAAHSKVKLADVKALTLHRDRMTTARRTSAIPQLACVGGDACRDFVPRVIQCTNQGSDGRGDFSWKCEADMDDYYRFGETTVACEGYAYPDDPYVLAGSCGVEYTLYLTAKGRQALKEQQAQQARDKLNGRQGSHSRNRFDDDGDTYDRRSDRAEPSSWWSRWSGSSHRRKPRVYVAASGHASTVHLESLVIWTAVFAFLGYALWRSCISAARPSHGAGRASASGSSGGSNNANNNNANNNANFPGSFNSGTDPNSPPPYPSASGSRPGFWSGFSIGGFLGSLFGNNNRPPYRSSYYTSYSRPASSSWFGSGYDDSDSGYYASRTRRRTPSPPPTRSTSSYSSSGSSTTPTTRTASGYGGTRRR